MKIFINSREASIEDIEKFVGEFNRREVNLTRMFIINNSLYIETDN